MNELKKYSYEKLLSLTAFTETKELLDAALIFNVILNRAKQLKSGFMNERVFQVITKPAQFQGIDQNNGEYQKALRMLQLPSVPTATDALALRAKVTRQELQIFYDFFAIAHKLPTYLDLLHGATHFVEKSDKAAVAKFEQKFKLKFIMESFNMRFYKA